MGRRAAPSHQQPQAARRCGCTQQVRFQRKWEIVLAHYESGDYAGLEQQTEDELRLVLELNERLRRKVTRSA
jgi:hypothetical protein